MQGLKLRFKSRRKPKVEQRMRTDFLFVSPSPWLGCARLLDIAGSFDRYNTSQSPEEADARAIYSDWRMVGEDLVDAMEKALRTEAQTPEQLPLPLR
jgi:hypothetical protein